MINESLNFDSIGASVPTALTATLPGGYEVIQLCYVIVGVSISILY